MCVLVTSSLCDQQGFSNTTCEYLVVKHRLPVSRHGITLRSCTSLLRDASALLMCAPCSQGYEAESSG